MKKVIYLICLAVLFISCSKDYLFKKNQIAISRELHAIQDSDQSTRFNLRFIDEKYHLRTNNSVFDSLLKAGARNKINTFDFSKIPSIDSQLTNFSQSTRDAYKAEIQTTYRSMDSVDSDNLQKTFKIIKKYGYPSFDNRKWIDTVNTRIGILYVLTHFEYESDEGKKRLKLMVREYLAGRVNEGEMKQFLWHVDGRGGYPYDYVINIEDWKKRIYGK